MLNWDLYGSIVLRLVLALLVGTVLGLNRWLHHKSAGIRTHSLVAIGSATAVMLISDFVQDDAQSVSRVLQGLITGLGFLGAGVIIHEQRSKRVHGHQDRWANRLGDIVDRAAFEAFLLVHLVGLGRQEDHRDMFEPRTVFYGLADLPAAEPWHHDVEQD